MVSECVDVKVQDLLRPLSNFVVENSIKKIIVFKLRVKEGVAFSLSKLIKIYYNMCAQWHMPHSYI